MKIFAYRFLWREEKNKSLCVKVVCGSMEEIEAFEKAVVSSEKVISASKEYLYEIDLEKMSNQTMIKKEDNEK